MERLSLPNPKWLENVRMGRWNRGTPKVLRFFDKIRGGGLWIPRGYMRQLLLLCRRNGVKYQIEDQRRTLKSVDFNFIGSLKPFQQEAAAAMNLKDFGTLNAPTGSGKTVIALYMIARRKQPGFCTNMKNPPRTHDRLCMFFFLGPAVAPRALHLYRYQVSLFHCMGSVFP